MYKIVRMNVPEQTSVDPYNIKYRNGLSLSSTHAV